MDKPLDTEQAGTLGELLARHGRLSALRALEIVVELAKQASAQRAAGCVELVISPTTVHVEEDGVPHLQSPGQTASLGGQDGAADLCPPEMGYASHILLPEDLWEELANFPDGADGMDPLQFDVCQLGALLCRMLTGESVSSYLRSPSTKAKLPVELRPLVERAIGSDGVRRFADSREFCQAAELLLRRYGDDPQSARQESALPEQQQAQPDRQHDTSPSIASPLSQSDTSVAGRAVAEARDDELPFQRIGHYEIVARIGHGGMGDVYKGYEPALKRTVAIKVLPEELARQEDFVRRFRDEAAAAARLAHPNIIQIYFIGEDAGHHYFSMQFVDGPTLAALLAERGRLTVEETLVIAEQTVSALAAAHKQGMAHRDIKPSNILLDRENRRALVADFGLVKLLQDSGHATATGVIMGTVDYISPEQGRGHAVDGRSDLYSVGVLMYQMLSGRLPFQADSATAMIFQHVYEKPPPLADVVRDVPAALIRLIEKLLAKSPDERCQSADELLADLRALRKGSRVERAVERAHTAIIQAPQFDEVDGLPAFPVELAQRGLPGWWPRTRERVLDWFRVRTPQWAEQLLNTRQQVDGAVAVYEERRGRLADLVAEADGVLVELRLQLAGHRDAALRAGQRADAARTSESLRIASREKSESEQFVAELAKQVRQQENELDEMRLKLARVDATLVRLRGQRDALNARLEVARARYALEQPIRPRVARRNAVAAACACLLLLGIALWVSARFARDSSQRPVAAIPSAPQEVVAAARLKPFDSPLILPDGSPGEVRRFSGHTDTIFDLAVGPGGHYALSGGLDKTIRLWDIETGGMVWMSQGDGRGVRTVAVSADGRSALAGTDGANILMLDLATGIEVRKFSGHRQRVLAVAFTPDGTHVLSAGADRTVRVWETGNSELIRQFEADPTRVLCAAFSSDGRRALVGGGRGVSLWDLDSAARLHEFVTDSASSAYPNSLAFSPDGRRAIIDWANGDVGLWDLETKEQIHSWKNLRGPRMTFAPDGNFALSVDADGFMRLWNLSNGKEAGRFGGYGGHIRSVAFLPQGRFALSGGGDDNTLRLWRLWAEERLRLDRHASKPTLAIFSPDGRYVVSAGDGESRGDYGLLLWDAVTGEVVHKLGRPEQRVMAMVFTRDGSQLVTAQDRDLRVWDVKSGLQTRVFRGAPDYTESLAFSPDESSLLNACSNGKLVLWDFSTGAVVRQFGGHSSKIVGVAFSRDGKRVYSGSWDKTVSAWEVKSGREAFRLPVGDSVNSMALSADGQFLLTAGAERLRLWSATEGIETERFAPVTGPDPRIRRAALSPDGRLCATSHEDGSIWLWNMQTGTVAHRFQGHTALVTSLTFSPDSRLVLSTSKDGTVRIWQSPFHSPEG